MGKINRILRFISFVSSLVYLMTVRAQPYGLSYAVKGTCVAAIAMIVFRTLRDREGRMLGASLLFSSLGDVLLGIDPEKLFTFGLGSFLIAHLLYIALFLLNLKRPVMLGAARLILLAFVIASGLVLTIWLWPGFGSLALPVVLYIVVITTMAVTSLTAGFKTPAIAVGAMLFMVSDSLIAIGKFKRPFAYGAYLVWAFYYVGQYCIAMGFVREKIVHQAVKAKKFNPAVRKTKALGAEELS